MEALDLEAQRALAIQMYPREWADTLPLPGEKRRRRQANLRHRAVYALKLAPLKAAGRNCASCIHYEKTPHGMKGRHCSVMSDFQGYAMVEPDHLCADWAAR
jgi:hypothetical protein